jgi:hypothetical protein
LNPSDEAYLKSCDSRISGQNISLQFVKLWSRWGLGLTQFWVTIIIIHVVTYTNKLLTPVMKRRLYDKWQYIYCSVRDNSKLILSEAQFVSLLIWTKCNGISVVRFHSHTMSPSFMAPLLFKLSTLSPHF